MYLYICLMHFLSSYTTITSIKQINKEHDLISIITGHLLPPMHAHRRNKFIAYRKSNTGSEVPCETN